MVAAEAAAERAHDGHGPDDKDHGAGDEALGNAASATGFALEPVSEAIHGLIQVQQLAYKHAQDHGENRDQGLLRIVDAGDGYAHDQQGQGTGDGLLYAGREELSGEQTHRAADQDGGTIDNGT